MSKRVPILVVHYEIHRPEHDGYCSDPGEETFADYVEKEYEEIDKETWEKLKPYVDLDNSVGLGYFPYEKRYETIGCGGGSGYCGYEGYRKISRAEIIISLADEIDSIFE